MSDANQSPALFEQGAVATTNDAAAVARAVQEIQAALVIALKNPRDEIKAKARILKACERMELAEAAEYEYTRGNTKITGPTIDLLRAIANRWGNIRFGWKEVERREGESSIRCEAWDCQSNGQAFREFVVKHWRDTREGGYIIKDERDIYEMLANQAARRVRACLEEVIDADIVQAAVDQCRKTLVQGAGKVPLKDQVVHMLNAFTEFGVTQDEIEKRLGNKLHGVTPNQLASLRRVYKSLKDGVGKKEDYFKPEMAKPEFDEPKPDPEDDVPMTFGGAGDARSNQSATAGQPKGTGSSVAPDPAAPKGAKPAPPEPESAFNPLKALRGLCAAAQPRIKEGKLLEYLGASGASDGSVGSIDELYMQNSNIVEALVKSWSDVVSKYREWDKSV